MTALLAIALFAPALALPLARFAPTAATARRWWSTAALALAGLWLVLLIGDATAELGRFGAGAAPVAIGTWLLVAAISWPTQRLPVALSAVTGGIAVGGASLLAGRGDASDAAGALALAAAVALVGARSEDDSGLVPATIGVLGAAAIALGVARDGAVLPALGAGAVAATAGMRPRRIGSALLPAAMLLGVVVGAGDRTAIVLAAAACVVAPWPGAALALWAIAAGAAGAPAAGLLLGAAAVLVTVVVNPVVAIAALPGAAALALALAHDGSGGHVLLALLAAVTTYRLVDVRADAQPGVPSRATLAALALAGWLVLAPQTWGWAAPATLPAWRNGILVAAAGVLLGAFLVASFTDVPFAAPAVDGADPAYVVGDPPWARRAAIAALAVLGICGIALVASSLT